MGSIKAIVGSQTKVSGENEITYEGTGLYAGQSGDSTFNWSTDPIALTASLFTINAEIRSTIIAASEVAGNSFNQVTDTIVTMGGPSAL